MEDSKSKVGSFLFIVFILCLIIGGQLLYYKVLHKDDVKENDNKGKVDYRIDKKKDFVYYTNESVISEGVDIYYKDVVINIKGQEVLTESLNKENAIYKENIKYISDQNLLSDDLINYNHDNLYMLNYRDYDTSQYKNYYSLLILDYSYDCFDLSSIQKIKSYVFDTNTGKLLTDDELLKEFNTSWDTIKEKMREHLTEKQEIVNEAELIKIDETINNLDNYGFTVNSIGNLVINFLVKTTQVDYNDNITIS